MPSLRQKTDGRYFIDFTLRGERTRIPCQQTTNGLVTPIRDKRTAEDLVYYCEAHRRGRAGRPVHGAVLAHPPSPQPSPGGRGQANGNV